MSISGINIAGIIYSSKFNANVSSAASSADNQQSGQAIFPQDQNSPTLGLLAQYIASGISSSPFNNIKNTNISSQTDNTTSLEEDQTGGQAENKDYESSIVPSFGMLTCRPSPEPKQSIPINQAQSVSAGIFGITPVADSTKEALKVSLKARDPYTESHCSSVASTTNEFINYCRGQSNV